MAVRKPKIALRPDGKPKAPYDPRINRWTGKPHEHKREKARRKARGAKP